MVKIFENLGWYTSKRRRQKGVAVPSDRICRNDDTSVNSHSYNCVDFQSNEISRNDDTSMNSHSQQLNETPIDDPEVEDDLRHVVKYFMEQRIVEHTILALIVINSLMMGIGTFDFISDNESANDAFYYCDLVFLIIFTIEVCLTIFHRRFGAFTDMWVVFDFLIISLSWTLSSVESFDPDGGETQSVQVIRSLRVFRILSRIESLRVVLTALSRSLKSLGCLAIFGAIIMFIFAIFFTEQYGSLFDDGKTEIDYFSRLDKTFFTLYQILTLDEWSNILREVQVTQPLAWIPFCSYVILTAFILVNLVIAIICESIFTLNSASDKVETMTRDMKEMELIMQSMRNEIFNYLELTSDDITLLQSARNVEERSKTTAGLGASPVNRPTLANVDYNEHGPANSSYWSRMTHAVTSSKYFRTVDVMDKSSKRALCGRIVNHKYVQGSIVGLIIINSILLAIGTFPFVAKDPSVNSAFDKTSKAFLVIYSIETGMQLIFHGLNMFRNGWHLFDFILIIFSWIFQISPSFRAIRVLRIVHILPKFEAMRTITQTLSHAIPKIGAIVGITTVFFYVFGVMCTTLFKDLPVGGENGLSFDYFSRLDRTILTLFQIMTMAEWASISRELRFYFWWAEILTSVFVTISGLLFINAIVALICQAQEHVISKRKEKKESSRSPSAKNNTFNKSYTDRVYDIKAMHREIIIVLNDRDSIQYQSDSNISYQTDTRSQSDTRSISYRSDDTPPTIEETKNTSYQRENNNTRQTSAEHEGE